MSDPKARSAAVVQLQWLLGCLRAQQWSYQESHWRTCGPNAYGNHLLFELLYNSVSPDLDTLGEKMVEAYGDTAVLSSAIGPKFAWWLSRWGQVDCLHERGLLSEQCLQSCCRRTYDLLKSFDVLSLGMDDFLMAMASTHERNLYLLRQVLRSPGDRS